MSDIFREVDEEFRRSQAEDMWRRYSGLVFAVCALIVLAVAGYRYYDWRREQAAAAAGASFEQALQLLQSGKAAEGNAALAKIASEDSGIYKALAALRLASDIARTDPKAAIRSFDQLANEASLDASLRDVARIRAASLAVDSEPFAEAERRMTPLIAPGNPWRFTALEMLAAAALKAGETDKARQFYDTIIIDRAAPEAVKARAEVLIGLARGTQ
ncbi:MAG: tetratricopeptide repeat protein [Methylocystis sp.]|nr:tetratricopeptide repeat protein [Methylocystis sp.]MCA3584060.1 tetratricopeptide repeat protein [Methylocystis sp.]MCA3588974.1 tetratricopeptide repeat protein [Methylocystis sp.]MCA3591180.1 tetratricopeptide repeat protein [Methylocystis sp.]